MSKQIKIILVEICHYGTKILQQNEIHFAKVWYYIANITKHSSGLFFKSAFFPVIFLKQN